MAGALIGALRVTLGIDTAAFENGLGIAQKRLNATGKKMEAVGKKMAGIGKSMSIAITAPLALIGKSAFDAATNAADALGQVNSALASMGPVAGRTSEELQKNAKELEKLSSYDDKDILRNVTANMLTFGDISGEAFDRAQLAAVNLSARLNQDLKSSTILIGKALNDPVKGLSALSRVGVKLAPEQEELAKRLAATGDVAGAQGVILAELEKQYGGAAKAVRDAAPGSDTINKWSDLKEKIGDFLLNAVAKIEPYINGVLDAFNNLSSGTQGFIVAFAAVAAAIGPVLFIFGSLVSTVGSLLPLFAPVIALIGEAGLVGALGAAATAAAPFIAAGAALAGAWYLFGDKIGPVLSALKDKFQDVLGPKLTALFGTVSSTLKELWNGPFGEAIRVVIGVLGELQTAYLSILGEVLIRTLSVLVDTVSTAFKVIVDVIRIVANLLTGDFSGAWNAVKSLVANVVNGWLAVLEDLAPGAIKAISALVMGVQEWIGRKLAAIWDTAKDKIQSLGDKFKWLWDVVVGNSYIPDLFDGIQKEAGRFLPEFVNPMLDGIDNVAASFASLGDKLPATANDNADAISIANVRIVDSFQDTANKVLDAVRATVDAVKGGGFLSILSSVIGLGLQLGSIGLFGKTVAANINAPSIGARAVGGPINANSPYLVGERGPELIVPRSMGTVIPNSDLTGSGHAVNVNVNPSPYFDAVVDGRAQAVAAPMSIRAAQAGADQAVSTVNRRSNNRIPGRF